MKVRLAVAMVAIAAVAFAQGARGPYHDRAEEDAALKRLAPDEELRVRAWAAEHPDAVRAARRKGGAPANAQDAMSRELDKELDKLSPEQKKELGTDIELGEPPATP
jgi:hypothetical protein